MIEIGKDGWIALPDPAPETLPDGTLVRMTYSEPDSVPLELFGAKVHPGLAGVYLAEFSRMSGTRYNGAFYFDDIVAIRLPEAPASEFYDAQPPDDELPEGIDVAMGRDGWEHRGLSLSSGSVYRYREARRGNRKIDDGGIHRIPAAKLDWKTVRRVPKPASSEECCAACGGPYEDGELVNGPPFRGAPVCLDCWALPEPPAALYERIRARGGWPRKATTETIGRGSAEAVQHDAATGPEPAKCAFCGGVRWAPDEFLLWKTCGHDDCRAAATAVHEQLRAGGVDCETTRRAALERLRRQRDDRSIKFAAHVHDDQRIAAAMRSEGKTDWSRDPAPEPSTHPASWPEGAFEDVESP